MWVPPPQPANGQRTSDVVADHLRKIILEGHLEQGAHLPPERELCALLGVGRPVLREALRTLELRGLVQLRPGKGGGAFLSDGSQNLLAENIWDQISLNRLSIKQLFEARALIQKEQIRLACARATAEDIDALKRNVDAAEDHFSHGRNAERVATNIKFHQLLAEATKNPVMVVITEGLSKAMVSLVSVVDQSSMMPGITFLARRKLIEGVVNKDEEFAIAQMVIILSEAEKVYDELFRFGKLTQLSAIGVRDSKKRTVK